MPCSCVRCPTANRTAWFTSGRTCGTATSPTSRGRRATSTICGESTSAFTGVAALTTGRQVFVRERGRRRSRVGADCGGDTEHLQVARRACRPRAGLHRRGRHAAAAAASGPGGCRTGTRCARDATPAAADDAESRILAATLRRQYRRRGIGRQARRASRSKSLACSSLASSCCSLPASAVERTPDLWTPLRIDFAAGSRINVFLRVIGRLKPGVAHGRSARPARLARRRFAKAIRRSSRQQASTCGWSRCTRISWPT